MIRFLILLTAMAMGGCALDLVDLLEAPITKFDAMYYAGFIIAIVCITMEERTFKTGWILGIATMLAACSVQAAEPNEMLRLRNTICNFEIRTMSPPYIGDGGESHGNCQMGINTARWIIPYAVQHKHVPEYMLFLRANRDVLSAIMHVRFIAEGLADAYIEKIGRLKKTRNVKIIAYHYNAGHNSQYGAKQESLAYAKEVVLLMAGIPEPSRPKFVEIQRTFARN